MGKPIAITLGDAAGVGPEIIAKAFLEAPDLTRGCFVVGDVPIMQRALNLVQRPGSAALPVLPLASVLQLEQLSSPCLPVFQVEAPAGMPPFGQISAQAGQLAGRCVIWAAQAALRDEIAALVTAPLNKEALAAAGPPYDGFPGHTEMLQAQTASFFGKSLKDMPVRMMLANEELRTVLVSIHVSLRQAIAAVTQDNVLQTLRITHAALKPVLSRSPRIAVAGLNPHAGEGGLFGHEEIEIIGPAIELAVAEGIDARGPYPPDTVFMRARASRHQPDGLDVVVAMYHDQGLIPVKYLGVEKGVNVTLGLPLVRTSPDHGTAFDIAGSGVADASSLIAAIRMARELAG
jgi:4-hydroxythreonine-4-phosphate dehydrogenase